jgi:hypothetical protein
MHWPAKICSFQGKQNNASDFTDAKLTDAHDQREEAPSIDDEKHGETQKLDGEWAVESPKGNDGAESPKKDRVHIITNDMNGRHGQLQEIQLDWLLHKPIHYSISSPLRCRFAVEANAGWLQVLNNHVFFICHLVFLLFGFITCVVV